MSGGSLSFGFDVDSPSLIVPPTQPLFAHRANDAVSRLASFRNPFIASQRSLPFYPREAGIVRFPPGPTLRQVSGGDREDGEFQDIEEPRGVKEEAENVPSGPPPLVDGEPRFEKHKRAGPFTMTDYALPHVYREEEIRIGPPRRLTLQKTKGPFEITAEQSLVGLHLPRPTRAEERKERRAQREGHERRGPFEIVLERSSNTLHLPRPARSEETRERRPPKETHERRGPFEYTNKRDIKDYTRPFSRSQEEKSTRRYYRPPSPEPPYRPIDEGTEPQVIQTEKTRQTEQSIVFPPEPEIMKPKAPIPIYTEPIVQFLEVHDHVPMTTEPSSIIVELEQTPGVLTQQEKIRQRAVEPRKASVRAAIQKRKAGVFMLEKPRQEREILPQNVETETQIEHERPPSDVTEPLMERSKSPTREPKHVDVNEQEQVSKRDILRRINRERELAKQKKIREQHRALEQEDQLELARLHREEQERITREQQNNDRNAEQYEQEEETEAGFDRYIGRLVEEHEAVNFIREHERIERSTLELPAEIAQVVPGLRERAREAEKAAQENPIQTLTPTAFVQKNKQAVIEKVDHTKPLLELTRELAQKAKEYRKQVERERAIEDEKQKEGLYELEQTLQQRQQKMKESRKRNRQLLHEMAEDELEQEQQERQKIQALDEAIEQEMEMKRRAKERKKEKKLQQQEIFRAEQEKDVQRAEALYAQAEADEARQESEYLVEAEQEAFAAARERKKREKEYAALARASVAYDQEKERLEKEQHRKELIRVKHEAVAKAKEAKLQQKLHNKALNEKAKQAKETHKEVEREKSLHNDQQQALLEVRQVRESGLTKENKDKLFAVVDAVSNTGDLPTHKREKLLRLVYDTQDIKAFLRQVHKIKALPQDVRVKAQNLISKIKKPPKRTDEPLRGPNLPKQVPRQRLFEFEREGGGKTRQRIAQTN